MKFRIVCKFWLWFVFACFSVKNEVSLRVFILKMSFSPISIVIFVISESKYVGIRSFKDVPEVLNVNMNDM